MFAAIDVGTNTVRLLQADVLAGRIEPHLHLRHITRLGGCLTDDGGLAPDAMARTLAVLKEFADNCDRARVTQLRAVGTAAFRQAPNGLAFAEAIKREAGLRVEIISGEEEARLTTSGALAALYPVPQQALIVDIGGGSTEFVLVVDGQPQWSTSRPLGVVRLTEVLSEHSDRQRVVNRELTIVTEELRAFCHAHGLTVDKPVVVGTAGTVTTLAALDMQMTDYDWRKVNNYRLGLPRIKSLYDMLGPLSIAQREALPGMEKGRGDLIVAGIEIISRTMETFSCKELVVSDFGLLEGALLSVAQKNDTPCCD